MSIHITPSPLDGPLGGGQAGATVTVEPLVTGQVQLLPEAVESRGGRLLGPRLALKTFTGGGEPHPCPCFLIRHPGAGAVLVDTGLHPSVASDPKHSFGATLARWLRPTLEPGMDVVSRLRERDLEPEDIGVVVMTHLHVDHASAISEFPDSVFVVAKLEWESASEGRPTARGYRHAQIDFAFDYRTVDYDGPRISSYGSFGRTFDLFGDGSVRLAFTPGHSAGHQSVICRLASRDFVIGGDAGYTLAQIENERAPLPAASFDEHMLKRSLREIHRFRAEYPDAIVTPGHDAAFYAGAEARYE